MRFGSAEIYDVIELCFPAATPEHGIVDCLAVGQSIEQGSDERVILFVKLPSGRALSPQLEKDIKAAIRQRRSPRHVPAKVSRLTSRKCGTHLLLDHANAGYSLHTKRQTC